MADANYLLEAIIGHPLIDSINLGNCFWESVNATGIMIDPCQQFFTNCTCIEAFQILRTLAVCTTNAIFDY